MKMFLWHAMTLSHQRLDQVHPLSPGQIDALEDDNFAFCLWLFDEDVDGYECSRPSNARTVQNIIMTLHQNDGVT